MNLPVNFESKIKEASDVSGGGYPVQISAADLMKNFVYSALEVDSTLIETTTGDGGHEARKLAIPAVPTGADPVALTATSGELSWAASGGLPTAPTAGTHVLGVVDGVLTWIATEEC